MLIRTATEGDLSAIQRIETLYETESVWQMEQRTAREETSVVFRTIRLPRPMRASPPFSASDLTQRWQDMSLVLVATDEGLVVGYLALEAPEGLAARITQAAVSLRRRRQGIGRQLCQEAMRWAATHQYRSLTAETQTKNYPAICLLHRCGFAFCGFNDRLYPNKDIALFFHRDLP